MWSRTRSFFLQTKGESDTLNNEEVLINIISLNPDKYIKKIYTIVWAHFVACQEETN